MKKPKYKVGEVVWYLAEEISEKGYNAYSPWIIGIESRSIKSIFMSREGNSFDYKLGKIELWEEALYPTFEEALKALEAKL